MRSRPRIGLLLNTLNHAYQNAVLLGAHCALAAAQADLYCLAGGTLRQTDVLNQSRNSLFGLVGPHDLDGYLLSSTLTHALTREELLAYCARFAPAPVCFLGVEVDGIPSVLVDDSAGTRELTNHLIRDHGRRDIAFLGGPKSSPVAQSRYAGYRDALAAHGLPELPELIFPGDYMAASGHAMVAQLFDQDMVACDAIVAINDLMAMGVLEALDRRGIRVPSQVAVVGFDDSEQGRFATPSLTSINQQIEEQSATAARLLLRRIRGESTEVVVKLPTRTVLRQSCGCLHKSSAPRPRDRWSQRPTAGSLDERRNEVAERIGQAFARRINQNSPFWATHLMDAFLSDLYFQTENDFGGVLNDLLRKTAQQDDVNLWHPVLETLQTECAASLSSAPDTLFRAEEILRRAVRQVGASAEQVQARRRLDYEWTVHQLQQMSADLRTSFDELSLVRTVAHWLPLFGVPSFYLALQEEDSPSPTSPARMLAAFRSGQSLEAGSRGSFCCGELVPSALRPDHRHTLVVEPLFFGNELLGFGAFEVGPHQSSIYEDFREHLSAAIKGVRLLDQLVAEGVRRQRAEQDRLESELELARRIQSGILPKSRSAPGLEIAATILPATEVGGDYFDILPFDDGVWLGIGDVVGHGLPAGIMMLMIQSLVAATVRGRPNVAPAEVWRTVNAVLCENIQERLEQDEYATLTVLRYDSSGRVTFSGAHEDILICRASTGQCEVVATPGTWAGLGAAVAVPEASLQLCPGDVLLLFTDGITEARDRGGLMFGQERLARELERVRRMPVPTICDELILALRAHSQVQEDDVTLVVARYSGQRLRLNGAAGVGEVGNGAAPR